jgi:hypothetical protein
MLRSREDDLLKLAQWFQRRNNAQHTTIDKNGKQYIYSGELKMLCHLINTTEVYCFFVSRQLDFAIMQ